MGQYCKLYLFSDTDKMFLIYRNVKGLLTFYWC